MSNEVILLDIFVFLLFLLLQTPGATSFLCRSEMLFVSLHKKGTINIR